MNKILMYWMLILLISACSDEKEYLEVNPELIKKEWKLDGRIGDKNITGMKPNGRTTFWIDNDESTGAVKSLPCYSVEYYKDGTNIRPGQLTFGSASTFVVEKYNKKDIVLKKEENHYLTSTAIVRILHDNENGKYILHINYEGKDYELNGYPIE